MKFEAGKLYHIYNRGNNSQQIFLERDNYLYFLTKIRTHLFPWVDILAYCLMPNHFHLLVYVPETGKEILNYSGIDSKLHPEFNSELINKNIGIILSSYTRAINKKHKRTGSLFQSKTKAKNVSKNIHYAFTCFHYIHQNPVNANLVGSPSDWEFSSYQDYSGKREGTICNKQLANSLLDIPLELKRFIQQSINVKIDKRILVMIR